MSDKVFIASTCYDLTDLRAEVASDLRDMGFEVRLSDDSLSDFHVKANRGSIESCLVNVRECDLFLLILCRRYGPSLRSAGYGDISATHLEYRIAREHGLDIRIFARRALEAEYGIWSANKDDPVDYRWVQDTPLFDFLKEARGLAAETNKPNWITTFDTSVELRQILRQQLRKRVGPAMIERLQADGKLPLLVVQAQRVKRVTEDVWEMDLQVTNAGPVPALNAMIRICGGESTDPTIRHIGCILSGQSLSHKSYPPWDWAAHVDSGCQRFAFECRYETPDGHVLSDYTGLSILLHDGMPEIEAVAKCLLDRHSGRCYHGQLGLKVLDPDDVA
ncbi:MAG: DUF4062 domain-containing protein [Planctomycetota bacterium]|jgi:hypothetical protein